MQGIQATLPGMERMDHARLMLVAHSADTTEVQKGEKILDVTTAMDYLVLVTSGTVVVSKGDAESPRVSAIQQLLQDNTPSKGKEDHASADDGQSPEAEVDMDAAVKAEMGNLFRKDVKRMKTAEKPRMRKTSKREDSNDFGASTLIAKSSLQPSSGFHPKRNKAHRTKREGREKKSNNAASTESTEETPAKSDSGALPQIFVSPSVDTPSKTTGMSPSKDGPVGGLVFPSLDKNGAVGRRSRLSIASIMSSRTNRENGGAHGVVAVVDAVAGFGTHLLCFEERDFKRKKAQRTRDNMDRSPSGSRRSQSQLSMRSSGNEHFLAGLSEGSSSDESTDSDILENETMRMIKSHEKVSQQHEAPTITISGETGDSHAKTSSMTTQASLNLLGPTLNAPKQSTSAEGESVVARRERLEGLIAERVEATLREGFSVKALTDATVTLIPLRTILSLTPKEILVQLSRSGEKERQTLRTKMRQFRHSRLSNVSAVPSRKNSFLPNLTFPSERVSGGEVEARQSRRPSFAENKSALPRISMAVGYQMTSRRPSHANVGEADGKADRKITGRGAADSPHKRSGRSSVASEARKEEFGFGFSEISELHEKEADQMPSWVHAKVPVYRGRVFPLGMSKRSERRIRLHQASEQHLRKALGRKGYKEYKKQRELRNGAVSELGIRELQEYSRSSHSGSPADADAEFALNEIERLANDVDKIDEVRALPCTPIFIYFFLSWYFFLFLFSFCCCFVYYLPGWLVGWVFRPSCIACFANGARLASGLCRLSLLLLSFRCF